MIYLKDYPEGSLTETTRVDNLTDDEFLQEYLRPSRPVVINNGARDWQAMKTWSFDYFRSLESEFTITIEEGNVMQEATSFRKLSFREYLDELENPVPSKGRVAYLSVFELFKHFPDLLDDVDFSIMSKRKLRNHTAGWIGPGGTVTGYHIDWADNIFVQIVGRKFVKLVPYDQSKLMYPSRKYDSNTLMSSVNADDYDQGRFPEFAKVDAMYAVLEPGDMMFIPRGCWHYVRAIDPSISVNNFGIDWKSFVRDKPREYAKKYLHRAGLYGKECTCHTTIDGKRVRRKWS